MTDYGRAPWEDGASFPASGITPLQDFQLGSPHPSRSSSVEARSCDRSA